MSQNPFGHPFDAQPEPDGPPRTSGLAIGAMVSSLICCIPLVGLIPAGLGVAGLVSISKSNGRLSGRGLAIAGIVLGMLGQMFWCGAGIALAQVIAGLKPYQASFTAIEAADLAKARQDMDPALAGLSDERMAEFRDAYQAKLGKLRDFPQGLKNTVTGWLALGPAMGNVMNEANQKYGQGAVIPLPANFDSGSGMVLFVIDTSRRNVGPSNVARIKNIGVAGEDGQIIWLMDPSAGP